jgi:hypothetical protein
MKLTKYLYLDVSLNNELTLSLVTGFEKENLEKALNIQKDWQPQPNDVLYFLPGCSVPRFKVKEEYTRTIKPDNATVAFASLNGIKEGSFVNVIKYCAPLEPGEISNYITSNFSPSDKLYIRYFMLRDQVAKVFVSERLISNWHTVFLNTNYAINDLIGYSKWGMRDLKQDLYAVTPESKINQLKCPIYLETEILKCLNNNRIIIDENKYEELRAFGLSGDNENLILMMELMANSDFEKSFIYLLFLLKEFGNKIVTIKEAHHVNFKSLLIYFGLNVKQLNSINLLALTAALKKHNKFTRSNVQRITSLCAYDQYDQNVKSEVLRYYREGYVLDETELEIDVE